MKANDQQQSEQADRQGCRHRLAIRQSLDETRQIVEEAVPSTEKPNSFGSWLTRMVTASPFM